MTRRWLTLASCALTLAACAPTPRARLASDPPLAYDVKDVARVRVLEVMPESRVLVERADGARFVLDLGRGCLQPLPSAAALASVPALVEPADDFSRPGAKLLLPVQRQGCWIERATRLARDGQ